MIIYLRKVQELMKKFVRVKIRHIPRAENSRTNALARLATASQESLDRLILVEHLTEPSVCIEDEEILPVEDQPSWMDPIMGYLQNGTLPVDPKEAAKLRTRSARFLFCRKIYINEIFQHLFSNAWEMKTPITYSGRFMREFVATTSELGL